MSKSQTKKEKKGKRMSLILFVMMQGGGRGQKNNFLLLNSSFCCSLEYKYCYWKTSAFFSVGCSVRQKLRSAVYHLSEGGAGGNEVPSPPCSEHLSHWVKSGPRVCVWVSAPTQWFWCRLSGDHHTRNTSLSFSRIFFFSKVSAIILNPLGRNQGKWGGILLSSEMVQRAPALVCFMADTTVLF